MSKVFEKIKNSKSILILTHENPDGDAIGSSMAMYHILSEMGKDVSVVIPEYPETFLFLDDIDIIKRESTEEYDLAIVVDCASKKRIGQNNGEFDNCKDSLIIDHHTSNTRYANLDLIEGSTSSCCQVIYYLLKKDMINISKKTARALATGMLTDSAGFRNCDVDQNTFLMAADLVGMGVDMQKIYHLVLSKKTMAQYMLMKMTLDRMEMYADGKIAFSYISKEDMENVGAKKGDHEGLVDIGRNIDGVEVSIFMREDNGYNFSFRSNGKVNVNEIAKKFDGGGHVMAAGGKIDKSFKETKEMLLNETIKEFK